MVYVKYAMVILGLIAAVLALVADILAFGAHGVIVLVGCLLPLAFTLIGHFTGNGFPRAYSSLSLIGLLIVGMKTSDVDEFAGAMICSFFGAILAIVLLIKPEPEAGS